MLYLLKVNEDLLSYQFSRKIQFIQKQFAFHFFVPNSIYVLIWSVDSMRILYPFIIEDFQRGVFHLNISPLWGEQWFSLKKKKNKTVNTIYLKFENLIYDIRLTFSTQLNTVNYHKNNGLRHLLEIQLVYVQNEYKLMLQEETSVVI